MVLPTALQSYGSSTACRQSSYSDSTSSQNTRPRNPSLLPVARAPSRPVPVPEERLFPIRGYPGVASAFSMWLRIPSGWLTTARASSTKEPDRPSTPCRRWETRPLQKGDPLPGKLRSIPPLRGSDGLEPLRARHGSNHSSHHTSAVLGCSFLRSTDNVRTKASTPACLQGPVLSAPLLRGEGKFGHQSPNRPTNTWPVPRQASQLPGLCRGAAIMAL